MPVLLPLNVSTDAIEKTIHDWLDYLSDEDYESAYQMTVHDPYYERTPSLMRDVIYGYGLPPTDPDEPIFKVTSWRVAATIGSSARHEINFLEHFRPHKIPGYSIVGKVWYDLPLNGEWSDLTATFNILKSESHIVLELNEIHIF